MKRQEELLSTLASSSGSCSGKTVNTPRSLVHPKEVQPVFRDEILSSENVGSGRGDCLLENCGFLSSNCLPRLTSTVVPVEKRSLSSSPPSSRKKADLKFPFKWKDGNPCATLRV